MPTSLATADPGIGALSQPKVDVPTIQRTDGRWTVKALRPGASSP